MQSSFQKATVAILTLTLASFAFPGRSADATIIRFVTTLGNIDFRLYDQVAPLHVANILQYINSNRYDGTFIHRSAKNGSNQPFVIQGGGYKILSSLLASPIESGWARVQSFGTVTNEFKLSNLRGTLALAKGSGISSGSSEWFINLNDGNTFLDLPPPSSNSFTVFGRVIGNGMTVADNIANLARVNVQVNGGQFNGAFNEVPVLNLATVQSQQDVFNSDVVQLIDSQVLNLPKGDYNFDGVVNSTDYTVWKGSFGSTTNAAADGNGDGVVNNADYIVWRNSLSPGAGSGASGSAGVPEPAAALLALTGSVAFIARRRRRAAF